MREILFRGKRIDNGEWVEGHYGEYVLMSGESISCISIPKKEAVCGSICYDVEASTVGQFTGVTDKNGKKIFEGDIIDMTGEWWDAIGPAHHDSPICAVEYDEFTGGFNPFANYDCDCGVYINASGCKAIGNIYDNPELLEGK